MATKFTALLCSTLALSAASALAESYQPQVFAFGPLVLDLHHQMVRFGPEDRPLVDCSDPSTFCVRSDLVTFAVPRRCADLQKERFGSGDVETIVLQRKVDGGTKPDFAREMLLGNPSRPNVVVGYEATFGVTYIFYDSQRKLDLVKLAREGKLTEMVKTDNYTFNIKRRLITFDKLAPCEA
ncbi:hypothetical protein [Sphingomonas morindae]|uniref:Uncharacterized protein n=1 Tax=Sphingomonas morindae TaxID=1541170 RepID=A0ABY4XAP2_9SPHN|nr:hypothetical protein [Sphingomonas morindae]USI73760.1 hypothetical protein LHA26_04630 [Sphingomonas morindae]